MMNAVSALVALGWIVLLICNVLAAIGYVPLSRELAAMTAIFHTGVLVWVAAGYGSRSDSDSMNERRLQ